MPARSGDRTALFAAGGGALWAEHRLCVATDADDWRCTVRGWRDRRTVVADAVGRLEESTARYVGGWWSSSSRRLRACGTDYRHAFEHRTYLSLIAVVVLEVIVGFESIGWLVRRIGGEAATVSVSRWSICIVSVAALTALTLHRNHDYRSELAMWRDVRFKVPHNRGAITTTGSISRRPARRRKWKKPFGVSRNAQLDPHYADAYLNLGALANWKQQYVEGERTTATFCDIAPMISAEHRAGEALVRLNRTQEAQPFVDRALELGPDNADARTNSRNDRR